MRFRAFAKRSGGKLADLSAESIGAIIAWGNNNARKLEYNSIYVITKDNRGVTQLCTVLDNHDGTYYPFDEVLPGSGRYQHFSERETWERAGNAHQEYINLISWAEFLWSEWIDSIFLDADGSEHQGLLD